MDQAQEPSTSRGGPCRIACSQIRERLLNLDDAYGEDHVDVNIYDSDGEPDAALETKIRDSNEDQQVFQNIAASRDRIDSDEREGELVDTSEENCSGRQYAQELLNKIKYDPEFIRMMYDPKIHGQIKCDPEVGDTEMENNSEEDESESQEDVEEVIYRGKDTKVDYAWSSKPQNLSTRNSRIISDRNIPRAEGAAKDLGDDANPVSLWKLLFDEEMLIEIVKWTNQKLSSVRAGLDNSSSYHMDTDDLEVTAFIGLLLLTSIFKSNHEDTSSLFSTSNGRPVYRSTMSERRFLILLQVLRFDDARDRGRRQGRDPTCLISNIFHRFICNSQRLYVPSESTCIGEMLVPFRGEGALKAHMPDKSGLKIMCLMDAKTSYLYNTYIYCGKDSDGAGLTDAERTLSKPTRSALRLVQPILQSNRNVTADSCFGSIEIVDQLKSRGLTYVGTLKKNAREIPPEFQASRDKKVGSAMFGFSENKTLVSYVPRTNKTVFLVSSMHHHSKLARNKKPEILQFYSDTQPHEDIFNMICGNYTIKRWIDRWPMAMFFAILNMCLVNSLVLHMLLKNEEKMTRFKFEEYIGMALTKPHAIRRLDSPNLSLELRNLIRKIHNVPCNSKGKNDGSAELSDRLEKKKSCSLCHYSKKRRTSYKCIKCDGPICLECSYKVCKFCSDFV